MAANSPVSRAHVECEPGASAAQPFGEAEDPPPDPRPGPTAAITTRRHQPPQGCLSATVSEGVIDAAVLGVITSRDACSQL
jgi:hypothetical protein